MYTQTDIHKISTASPLVYNNMGWLGDSSQRAGSPGLNGGGASAAVSPEDKSKTDAHYKTEHNSEKANNAK